jgi:hypothetical protein
MNALNLLSDNFIGLEQCFRTPEYLIPQSNIITVW